MAMVERAKKNTKTEKLHESIGKKSVEHYHTLGNWDQG